MALINIICMLYRVSQLLDSMCYLCHLVVCVVMLHPILILFSGWLPLPPLSTELPGPKLGRLDSGDRSCLFHSLFKPSEDLMDRTLLMQR